MSITNKLFQTKMEPFIQNSDAYIYKNANDAVNLKKLRALINNNSK